MIFFSSSYGFATSKDSVETVFFLHKPLIFQVINMAIVKKKKRSSSGTGGSKSEISSLRPEYVEKTPPCIANCPNHNKIREVMMTISKTQEYEKTYDQTLEEAWHLFMETSPFPSVCGRVCPHPCEGDCNRKGMEGSVSVNDIERFIGDFGLQKQLKPKKLTEEKKAEKIAIVGSGPAGLACAYHLARRGYQVTVFEAFEKAGGMLRYGIPKYRLPWHILDAEIQRIADMGVEIRCNTKVGKDISYDELRKDYKAIFIGIGAHTGKKLGAPGEDASNVMSGVEFLHRISVGEKIDVGNKVVVVGGGDTAIDAARVSRRLGADVTILYRRTRAEMPAIVEEIKGAEEEGVHLHFLAAPIEVHKEGDRGVSMKCQQMELGEPDKSGRRRPVPIEGQTFDLPFTMLIPAISQEPDFKGIEDLIEGKDWIKVDGKGKTKAEGIYSGGDNIELGLAVTAIYHGRRAAEAIHEMISGVAMPKAGEMKIIRTEGMQTGFYAESKRATVRTVPLEERLKGLDTEINQTLTQEETIEQAKRCMSCGKCFDCGTCWSYCQESVFVKPVTKGELYTINAEICIGCEKCAQSCPCGFIEMH